MTPDAPPQRQADVKYDGSARSGRDRFLKAEAVRFTPS
jgi:hypothetical protein